MSKNDQLEKTQQILWEAGYQRIREHIIAQKGGGKPLHLNWWAGSRGVVILQHEEGEPGVQSFGDWPLGIKYDELEVALGTRPLPDVSQRIFVFTDSFYWGMGSNLEEAVEKVRKAGAKGSVNAVIYQYTGPEEELKKITVDGGGGVNYPASTVHHQRIGKIKLPTKQPPKKK